LPGSIGVITGKYVLRHTIAYLVTQAALDLNPKRKKNLRKRSNARVKGHDILHTTSADITERRKMEEELKNREERYRSLFQNSRDAICITAPDGKFIDFNQAWLDLFGYDREEMLRLGVREIYADPASWEKFLQEMRKKGFVKDYELKVRRKDGAERDCLLTSAPWRASDETVLGYQGILRDMTERKRIKKELAESEQNYRDLTDNAATGMTTVDLKGRFTYVNRVMADFIGHSAQDLMGRPFKDYIHPEDRGRIMRLFLNVILLRRMPREVELRAMGPDGIVHHLLMRPSRIRMDGKTVGFSAVMIDITERRRMEDELRRSEERFRKIFQSSPIPALITSIEGPILDVNDAWVRMSGYSREEATGHSTIELGMMPDLGQRDRTLKDLLKKRRLSNLEMTRRTKSGELRDLLNTIELVELGGQKCILNMQVDITERKRTEEALKSSEQRLRILFEYAPDAYYLNDLKGILIDGNKAAEKTTGFKKEELIGKSFLSLKLLPPEQIPKAAALLLKNALGQPTGPDEFTLNRKDGNLITAEIRTYPVKIRDESLVLGIARDITERKRLENELKRHSENLEKLVEERTHDIRESEEKYRLLVDNMTDAVFAIDLEGNLTYCSQAGEKMTGYSLQQLLSMNISDLIAPEHLARIQQRLRARVSGEKHLPAHQFELIRADGKRLPVEMSTSPLLKEGHLVGIQGIARDITERKRAEEDLRESEQKFRRIFNASLDGIYVTSIDGKILDMNPAGVSMLGFDSLDELQRVNITTLYVKPEERKRLIELARKGPVRNFDVQFKRKDGTIIDCILNVYPLRDEMGRMIGLQGAIIDITERRHMERMRDEFVADVTDELLTPLVSMKGYIDYVLKEKLQSLPEDIVSSLQVVRRNTDRLLDLTNDLVDIRRMETRKLKLNLQPLNLREIVEQCVTETHPLIAKKQSLRVELPEGPLPIQGDPARLSQVLMNLLSNAVKYTPEGEIILRVKAMEDAIEVQVSDTGIGIKKEDLPRIFEPFAAIKKPTYVKGAGLGLSITKGLVEAHGGRIWAESAGEGKGATFTFTIPKRKEVD